jgi:pSer/pThr/pTyr-binding forkhead associated (FHA) protein
VTRVRLIPQGDGPTVELTKDLTLVGRDDGCDVRLDHKSVSKLHCVLAVSDELLLVRDLGSTNGTRVNGQRVRRAAVLAGDQLAIATFKFQVKFGGDVAGSVPLPDPLPSELPADMRSADDSGDHPTLPPGSPPMQRNPLPDHY